MIYNCKERNNFVSLCKTSNKFIHAFPFQIPFCSFRTVKLNKNNDVLFGLSLVSNRYQNFVT